MLNVVFVAAWRAGIREIAGVTPHVMVLLYVTTPVAKGSQLTTAADAASASVRG